ncbi:hypothetical protein [Actinocorallia longicatena]|uniref:Glycosyltransferase RgtA/B/C/D-like domain-containing protein n=1 Tax=Actinocorallia longicatena TaxID=111803 RepID=A0ABP6QMB6_9ACTN
MVTRRLLLPALVLAWAALVTLRHTWAGDMRLHEGVLHALLRDTWSPVDPMVGAVEGSPYFSPPMVALAAVARLLHLRVQTVLELSGLVNVAVWLWALTRFCRRLGGPAVAVLAIVFELLLWGLSPREWSGFPGLFSLSWTMAYPSLLATGLMLLAWDLYLDRRWWPLVPVLALIALTHPFTAFNTGLGLAAFALARPGRLKDRRAYAAAAAAAGLVLLWPWSDPAALAGAAGGLSEIHRRLALDLGGDFGFSHFGLALAGLPALVSGASRRPMGRELLLLFSLTISVVGLGLATGTFSLARALPVAVLPLHLALASALAGTGAVDGVKRRATAGLAVAACAAGIVGNSGGLVRAWQGPLDPRTLTAWGGRSTTTVYDPLVRRIRAGTVVLGDQVWPGRLVVARGAYTVVPPWPYPFVDEAARRRDTRIFFAPATTPAQRAKIVERYRVGCVLAARRSPALRPGAVAGFRKIAETRRGGVRLICR